MYLTWFLASLKPKHSVHNTSKYQSDCCVLEVLQFVPPMHKYSNQFGLSFAYDAQKIWSHMSDYARSATSRLSFRKKLNSHPIANTYPL